MFLCGHNCCVNVPLAVFLPFHIKCCTVAELWLIDGGHRQRTAAGSRQQPSMKRPQSIVGWHWKSGVVAPYPTPVPLFSRASGTAMGLGGVV